MKILAKIIGLLFISIQLLKSQSIQVKLLDENFNPIDYANIQALNSKAHTHSDINGNFSLENVSIGDSLSVTHLLYESIIISINQSFLNNEKTIILKNKSFQLDELVIGQEYDALKTISFIDLESNPVNSSQEILRKVPGLIIGQHAGGGKAEQIFLRGFDIDHGTDINLSVDGIPVNMVSHAHGQGYADLHFLIPETIDKIDYGKGPYNAEYGNFATAGYVNFQTKQNLENSIISTEIGDFNTIRSVILANLLKPEKDKNSSAYVGLEYTLSDGPFESPQGFSRLNLFSKYSISNEKSKITITGSHFTSRWDASGQIPLRSINDGSITKFGAIDDTEGGETSRTNLAVAFNKYISNKKYIKSNIYFSKYDFLLFSNFTFFLNDPINGDQIKQKESRNIYGANFELNQNLTFSNFETILKIGTGIRYDDINGNELSSTLNRYSTLNIKKLGDINESNLFTYGDINFNFNKLKINTALRFDYFNFKYTNQNQSVYSLNSSDALIISPKLNLQYSIGNQTQIYLKTGRGFHSNDTRLNLNPNRNSFLPAAYGFDLGTVLSPFKNLIINAAYWQLHLEQEFVYVGDEGIIEPNGRTLRTGFDIGLRYQLLPWMFIHTNINTANPKFKDNIDGNNYIPLAPTFTNTGGVSISPKNNLKANLNYRLVSDRAANEDNSIVAEGYTVFDLNVIYTIKNISIGFEVNNVFNTDWKETQFATESRLQNENTSVEEIHFTPGFPRFIKGKLSYMF